MAMAPIQSAPLKAAKKTFVFNSAVHLLRIGTERATNLAELLEGVRACSGASIFQHMFRTMQEHHFIREGFSNDFAHWAFSACNETGLAERLAGIDIREFTEIETLRQRIIEVMESYLARNPRASGRTASEAFYFCAAETVVVPTSLSANNLAEFADGVRRVNRHSIHFHFIDARLRLKLDSNDFSIWLAEEMEMPRLADRVNRIDIYTNTLEGVRQMLLKLVQNAILAAS